MPYKPFVETEVGDQFDRWTVIAGPELRQRYNQRSTMVQVRCMCGTEKWLRPIELEKSQSCGCLQKEITGHRATKHGLAKHPLHVVWRSMRDRCRNPHNDQYGNYGGRGIVVCAEWDDFQSFYDWSLANGWAPGLQIDRQDNDGNYEPSNCRWVTQSVNMRNTRHSRHITAWGDTKTMAAWLEDDRCVIKKSGTLGSRLDKGWEPELAMTTSLLRVRRGGQ